MEKSWENFWTTGKVEDYLTYCNRVEDDAEEGKRKQTETQMKKDVPIQQMKNHTFYERT